MRHRHRHHHRNILIALAGQPNVGKSTVFNMLTGARQHVANFPGVTVEKKAGAYSYGEHRVNVVDLPGTYSMTSYSQEERVARDFILLERPEVVVVVMDASNIARDLYLAFQLREMGAPLLICLNMMDVAARRGISVDADELAKSIDTPVIPVVGKKGEGRDVLMKKIHEVADNVAHHPSSWRLDYGSGLEPDLDALAQAFQANDRLSEEFDPRWLAVKAMENDSEVRRLILHHAGDDAGPRLVERLDALREKALTLGSRKMPEKIIAATRHRHADAIAARAVTRERAEKGTMSDKIDNVVLNPVAAPFILGVVLLAFYEITMELGTRLADWFYPTALEPIGRFIASLFPVSADLLRESHFKSLVVDGLAQGILSILYYLPIFLILFALIAILEDSGYMARIAFVMDRVLRAFGLHGQATLPMLLGGVIVGGCAVPGVMATRAMKDEKAKLLTILIMPMLNCMAKIPLYMLVVSIFFPFYQGLIVFAVSLFSFILAMVVSKVFSATIVRGPGAPFVMELPGYHVPTVKHVIKRSMDLTSHFLWKVVTIIAAVQVMVWFFSSYPGIGYKNELTFDHRLETAREQMENEVGAKNPYSPLIQDNAKLIQLVRFAERYDDATEAKRATTLKQLETENPEFYAIMSGATWRDASSQDADAARKELAAYIETVDSLKRERAKLVIADSFAGRLGRGLEPITQYAGVKWRMNIAIISSFAAKESLVGTLGALYSAEGDDKTALVNYVRDSEKEWTIWRILALLAIIAMLPPCLPTLVMIKAETNTWKWPIFTAIYPLILGFTLATLIYQFGQMLGGA